MKCRRAAALPRYAAAPRGYSAASRFAFRTIRLTSDWLIPKRAASSLWVAPPLRAASAIRPFLSAVPGERRRQGLTRPAPGPRPGAACRR